MIDSKTKSLYQRLVADRRKLAELRAVGGKIVKARDVYEQPTLYARKGFVQNPNYHPHRAKRADRYVSEAAGEISRLIREISGLEARLGSDLAVLEGTYHGTVKGSKPSFTRDVHDKQTVDNDFERNDFNSTGQNFTVTDSRRKGGNYRTSSASRSIPNTTKQSGSGKARVASTYQPTNDSRAVKIRSRAGTQVSVRPSSRTSSSITVKSGTSDVKPASFAGTIRVRNNPPTARRRAESVLVSAGRNVPKPKINIRDVTYYNIDDIVKRIKHGTK